MNVEQLIADIKRDEGLRLKPYKDSVDKWSIGYGRNLDDTGITVDEANHLLSNDISTAIRETASFSFYNDLAPQAQRALVNMVFNMGLPRVKGFKKMLAALEAGDYNEAAHQALDSKWASQVGARADRIADLFRECTGE